MIEEARPPAEIEFISLAERPLTIDDFMRYPTDNIRRELFDGTLIIWPTPGIRHQQLVGEVLFALARHIEQFGGGEVLPRIDVVLSPTDIVEPDVTLIADWQSGIVTEANIQGVPALMIEVLSDSRIERVLRRDLYARFGGPEYCVIDPDADRVELYRFAAGKYAKPEIFERGDRALFGALPGFSLDVEDLFADLLF